MPITFISLRDKSCRKYITICNIDFLSLKYLHSVSRLLHYIDFYKTRMVFLAIACPEMYLYLCYQKVALCPILSIPGIKSYY